MQVLCKLGWWFRSAKSCVGTVCANLSVCEILTGEFPGENCMHSRVQGIEGDIVPVPTDLNWKRLLFVSGAVFPGMQSHVSRIVHKQTHGEPSHVSDF